MSIKDNWLDKHTPLESDIGWGVNTTLCIGIVKAWYDYCEELEKIWRIRRGNIYGSPQELKYKVAHAKQEVKELEKKCVSLRR